MGIVRRLANLARRTWRGRASVSSGLMEQLPERPAAEVALPHIPPELDPKQPTELAAAEIDAEGFQPDSLVLAQAEGRLIVTEYPYRPRPRRFGATASGRRLTAWLSAADPSVAKWLDAASGYSDDLKRIPVKGEAGDPSPAWINGMLPGLDSLLLYTAIRLHKPKTYLEIGSGNSTKFVRRAIEDGGLSTRIISIDPHPRAEIDALCDIVVRSPIEDLSQSKVASYVTAGDVVFIDNSHRSFPNSDVTVVFTELLPELSPGVFYGIHDIWLPYDYPPYWMDRFYNEQYLLAAYLLGGAGGDEIIFPAYHVYRREAFKTAIRQLFSGPSFRGVARHGATFWMRRGGEERS